MSKFNVRVQLHDKQTGQEIPERIYDDLYQKMREESYYREFMNGDKIVSLPDAMCRREADSIVEPSAIRNEVEAIVKKI